MPNIRIKGRDLSYLPLRDSATRRAQQLRNRIAETLGKLGINPESVDVNEEPMPIKNAPARARWYGNGAHCLYSYARARTYIDNLQIVCKLLEAEVADVLAKRKTAAQFIEDFTEEKEVEEHRKQAREALGFPHDHHDLESITAHFKKRSRELHPDMPTGDTQKFQELNKAHKTLKRELE